MGVCEDSWLFNYRLGFFITTLILVSLSVSQFTLNIQWNGIILGNSARLLYIVI